MDKETREKLFEFADKHNMLNTTVAQYALGVVIWLTALTIWVALK